MVLFCYGEIAEKQKREIENHLKECGRCFRLYEESKKFFSTLKIQKKEISSLEIEALIKAVRARLTDEKGENLREKVGYFFNGLWYGIIFRYKVASVIAGIIIFLLLLPTVKYKKTPTSNLSMEILQVEMELSLEDEDISEFDVYYNFNDLEKYSS